MSFSEKQLGAAIEWCKLRCPSLWEYLKDKDGWTMLQSINWEYTKENK